MKTSESSLPPNVLAAISCPLSQDDLRIQQPAATAGRYPQLSSLIYAQQLGWAPVDPNALLHYQAQCHPQLVAFAQLPSTGVHHTAAYPTPSPAENVIPRFHTHAQAPLLAAAYQSSHHVQLEPEPSPHKHTSQLGQPREHTSPASRREDPFVYVNPPPTFDMIETIHDRALFTAPLIKTRIRVAQACETCRKRKTKVCATLPCSYTGHQTSVLVLGNKTGVQAVCQAGSRVRLRGGPSCKQG